MHPAGGVCGPLAGLGVSKREDMGKLSLSMVLLYR